MGIHVQTMPVIQPKAVVCTHPATVLAATIAGALKVASRLPVDAFVSVAARVIKVRTFVRTALAENGRKLAIVSG